MEFNFDTDNRSIIKVFGVGGCGCNAVSKMLDRGVYGVDFVVLNTDNQSLNQSPVKSKVQLGQESRKGLGSGANPDVGKEAALESAEEVKNILSQGTKMLFITAGMGKGTGTGAGPEIAKMAKEMGILTIAVVTMPFEFEGPKKKSVAEKGLAEMKKNVDCFIVIENEKAKKIYGSLPSSQAYDKANEILMTAVKGLSEIITVPNEINVDFEDVKTVMTNSGVAILGSATASGEDRVVEAVKKALHSPLLPDNVSIHKFSDILLKISSGEGEHDITLDQISEICNLIRSDLGEDKNVTYGQTHDKNLGAELELTIVATGFSESSEEEHNVPFTPNDVALTQSVEVEQAGKRFIQPPVFQKDSKGEAPQSSEQPKRFEMSTEVQEEPKKKEFKTSLGDPNYIPAYERRGVKLEEGVDGEEQKGGSLSEIVVKTPGNTSDKIVVHRNSKYTNMYRDNVD